MAGALPIENSTVTLQQKVMSTLSNVDSGAMMLESDQYIGGRWVTVPDALTPRRVELPTNLAHDLLPVSHQLASAEYVPVYLITDEVVENCTVKLPPPTGCAFPSGNRLLQGVLPNSYRLLDRL